LMGAVIAQLTVELAGNWTTAYFIGGALGIMLLFLRIGVLESGLYKEIEHKAVVSKGNFLSFFTNGDRFVRYMKCIAIGLPTWFCVGILAFFANQFAAPLGIISLQPGKAIMWTYVGISAGDFASGFISHALKSRKKAILYMMLFTLIGIALMLGGAAKTEIRYYFFCAWLGLGTGYWAMFVTVAAEQFGTNIRNTATTTVPNIVRGLVPVMTLGFNFFKPGSGVVLAAIIIGAIAFTLGLYATVTIPETHNRNLDFTE
ncbi:MAG: MFS transporter, partial [Sphingobacteriales bacterium]